jgi:hypothetical protein
MELHEGIHTISFLTQIPGSLLSIPYLKWKIIGTGWQMSSGQLLALVFNRFSKINDVFF